MLLVLIIFAVDYTNCSELSVEQRVQQLKQEWYKEADNLAKLGDMIAEKDKKINYLLADNQLVLSDFGSEQLNEEGTNKIKDEISASFEKKARAFYKRLFNAFRDKVNMKGFCIQELIYGQKEFLKKDAKISFLDRIKLNLLRGIIEAQLTEKLINDYEVCLQKLAEIESELVALGQPRLYE